MIPGISQNCINSVADGSGIFTFQENTSAQLLNPLGNALLFCGLWIKDQRYLEVESLTGAVHATVGQESRGRLEYSNLINRREDTDILRKRTQLLGINERTTGNEYLIGAAGKSRDAVFIESQAFVHNGTQGNIDQRLLPFWEGATAVPDGRPDKGILFGKSFGSGLELFGCVDDGVGVIIIAKRRSRFRGPSSCVNVVL